VTYTGTTSGVEITVTSTGIGGPSLAIAVEELVRLGADTLIRVGTGGAMQKTIMPGELIVGTGAIRDEGTSRAYMPIEFPAVGDPTVIAALAEAAADVGHPWHTGIIHSKDSFYGQKEPERMPVADRLQSHWNAWVHGGALLSEMETATLFVLASVLGVRSGSICAVGANDFHNVNLQEGEERESAIDRVITASLGAVQRLATNLE
jgi:uridine phosphorylase